MKIIKYLLSTLKFYAQTFFCTAIFVIVSCLFIGRYSTVVNIYQTINNTSCHFVSYDTWFEDDDTYEYFDNKIDVFINNPDSLLNVLTAQFIEDEEYTSASYINIKNVAKGAYRALNKGEVALPISFKDKWQIDLDSTIVVNNIECRVVFFFNDIYQIHVMNPSVHIQCIFVGKETINLVPDYYLNFNPSFDTKHVKLFSIDNNIRRVYINSLISLSVLLEIIYLSAALVSISYFKIKRTRIAINQSIVNGETCQQSMVTIIEILYLVITLVILATITLWNVLKLLYPLMALSLLITSLINIASFFIYISERKRAWKK